MKYFAILKDSMREALDSKVLYVLLVVSTLIVGFVATLSFKPLSAEKAMGQFFISSGQVPLAIFLDSHKPEKAHELKGGKALRSQGNYRLVKVDVLRGEPDAPTSDYLVTIAHMLPSEIPGDLAEQRNLAQKAAQLIFQEAEEFDLLRIGAVELVDEGKQAGEVRHFQVAVHSTSRTQRMWPAEPSIMGFMPVGKLAAPLGFQLYVIAQLVLDLGAWLALLVGVVVTSFFFPNMLRKGTVDLLLAKPLQRWILVLYKFIGGLTFIFLNAAYAIGGIWLVLGIRTGVWPHGLLLVILTITFFFAILYAISTLVAVLTRSTVTAIMVTIIAWLLFFGIGTAEKVFHNRYIVEQDADKRGRPIAEEERWGDNQFAKAVYAIHAVMPRTSDLNQLNDLIVFTDFMTGSLADMNKFDTSKRNWWDPVLVSGAWIGIFLGLSACWFSFKDY